MTGFDPVTVISNASKNTLKSCSYFNFDFDTEYDESIWEQLNDNFFYKSLKKISKYNGKSEVMTVGVFGESRTPSSFILTDLDSTHILCSTRFTFEAKPGTLLLINCPEIVYSPQYSMIIEEEKQIIDIGFVKSFGYCQKQGSHLACTKFIDKSKDTLCSFHKSYYRLKIANQFLVQSRLFPTSIPISQVSSPKGTRNSTTRVQNIISNRSKTLSTPKTSEVFVN